MTIQQISFCTFKFKFKVGEVTVNPTGRAKDSLLVYTVENNPLIKYEWDESNKLIINAAGEYEADDIFVMGEKAQGAEAVLYTVGGDDISIGIISFINKGSSVDADFFEETDILVLNTGGKEFFDTKEADEIIQRISPKICFIFGFKEQWIKGGEGQQTLEEAKADIKGLEQVAEKSFKVTREELDRMDNTVVYYFEL